MFSGASSFNVALCGWDTTKVSTFTGFLDGTPKLSLCDTNECISGAHSCDANAYCNNTDGDFACDCNAGYNGDGAICDLVCEAGKYAANASVCVACPANTHSLFFSDKITDCICNIGFEGVDGAACRGCGTGFYKGMNGSGACL
eukprot:831087-Rhodomonas_salina.2